METMRWWIDLPAELGALLSVRFGSALPRPAGR